jgi:hypothetical protein
MAGAGWLLLAGGGEASGGAGITSVRETYFSHVPASDGRLVKRSVPFSCGQRHTSARKGEGESSRERNAIAINNFTIRHASSLCGLRFM